MTVALVIVSLTCDLLFILISPGPTRPNSGVPLDVALTQQGGTHGPFDGFLPSPSCGFVFLGSLY